MKIRIEQQPSKWDRLSIRERAAAIRQHVSNTLANGGSLTDISIDDVRHRFDEGGVPKQRRTSLNAGPGHITEAPDGSAIAPSVTPQDIMYRILSQGSHEGTDFGRSLSDITQAIEDERNNVPMTEDRYTGSWIMSGENDRDVSFWPNTNRDINYLFSYGEDPNNQFQVIADEDNRGYNPQNLDKYYYGNFALSDPYLIDSNRKALFDYVAKKV